jgi:hypothetical protein
MAGTPHIHRVGHILYCKSLIYVVHISAYTKVKGKWYNASLEEWEWNIYHTTLNS